MTAVILPMTSPNRLKRTCQDAGFQNFISSTSENQDGTMVSQLQPENPPSQEEHISSVHRGAIAGTTQPMIQTSIVESSLAGDATPAAVLPTISKSATINKRRKLTPAEQEARRLEKEAKDRQRADEKAKVEESRRVKEMEKEGKRKDKEAQTRQREEERRRKEEEKTKKDKARLMNESKFRKS